MSRFDEVAARTVAEAAVRGQVAPLLGKEDALLAALRRAEAAHDQVRPVARAELQAEEELAANMRAKGGEYAEAYKRVADGLRKAITAIEGMDDTALRFLGWSAYARGLASTTARRTNPLPLTEIAVSYHDHLVQAMDAAEGARLKLDAGRRPGKTQPPAAHGEVTAPLDAFVAVMSAFWTETVASRPTIESGPREPTAADVRAGRVIAGDEPKSPALRMMFEATRRLTDESGRTLYELPAVEGAMKRWRALDS